MLLLRLFARCIVTAVVTFALGWLGYAEYGYLSDSFGRQAAVRTIKASPTADCVTDPPVEVATYTYTAAPPEPATVDNDDDVEVFFVGEYYLLNENIPDAFRSVEYISIETHEFSATDSLDPWVPIAPRGSVHTFGDLEFTKIAVSKRYLTFETEAYKGISYRFSGRPVIYGQKFDQNDVGDIKGKFSKLKNGKEVASFTAVFNAGGC